MRGGLTERQFRRREKILSVARELIAEHGYNGVRMRELADRSGVTAKTLYHQFDSKENLLRVAVEERFRHTYETINSVNFEKGIDRLFYVVETIAESTRKNYAYAQALAPVLRSSRERTFIEIRLNTYRAAVQQIADEGDLLPWAEVETTAAMVCRHVNPLYANRMSDGLKVKAEDITIYDVCTHLRAITRGRTHKIVTERAKLLAEQFRGKKLV